MRGTEYLALLVVIAKLHYVPSLVWMEGFFSASRSKLPELGPVQLAGMIRALAKVELHAWDLKSGPSFKPWISAFLNLTRAKMHMFNIDEKVRIITCLGEISFKPSRDWLGDFSAALRNQLGGADSTLLSTAVLAMATLGYTPDPVFMKAYSLQLYSKLPLFDDRDLTTAAQVMLMLRRFLTHACTCTCMQVVTHAGRHVHMRVVTRAHACGS